MQLKKTRKVLPILTASQGNKGPRSLTTLPKQTNVDKANTIKANDENCNFAYKEAEESELYPISCIKCRCVQDILAPQLHQQKCQDIEDDYHVCSKCPLSVLSTLNFQIVPAVALDTEAQEKMSLNKPRRAFKVKNFQPDKYYCDKCRFSTKDPLQHKKHVAQHEKIKFICSQCDWVSYTKGEFERHLVKHTGRFPYQCKYCDYGAVRHDYIVKHTKRLHATEKQEMISVAKVDQKRNCSPEHNLEWKKHAVEASLQVTPSRLSQICGIKNEIPEIDSSSVYDECSQSTAFIQDKNVNKLSDVRIHKNEDVLMEVEVYSPKKGPITPGVPLTVVAPAKFCVPHNCLAQIVEIKRNNGTQQLILKLIPPKGTTSKEVESGNQCAEQEEKTINNCVPPALESCALDNENDENCLHSASSTTLNCSLINTEEENAICKENAQREYDLLPPLAEFSSEKTNCPELFQKGKCSENKHTTSSSDPAICLAAPSSKDKNKPQSDLLDTVQKNNSLPPSSVFGNMRFTLTNAKEEQWNELRVAAKTHLFDSHLFHPFERAAVSQQNKSLASEESENVLGVINGINVKRKKDNMEVEAHSIKYEGDSVDGPVISSVFSLSSGAVNIPEGIKWDDTLQKKRSTSLLCRKIAQLMSAVESNVKSQLAASLRHSTSQASKEKVLSPEKKSEKTSSNMISEQELVPSPRRPKGATFSNECSIKQEQPLETLKEAKTKTRLITKTNTVSPAFIPQGTVLRVLNCSSSEASTEKQNGDEMSPSPSRYCNKMFIPRPVPCCVSARLDKGPTLPAENEVNEVSRNLCVSYNHTCHSFSSVPSYGQQNGMLSCQKGSSPSGLSKRAAKGEEPQNKAKRAHSANTLPQKGLAAQEERFLKMVPTLMRCLRLVAFKSDQLIKCPHRNQPVVVLNHPDVDSPEVISIMKVINKYKGNVLKAVLSERTISCLSVKRHYKRLTFQTFDRSSQVKQQKKQGCSLLRKVPCVKKHCKKTVLLHNSHSFP
ncbi:zinc finger protein 518B isoform X3 [Podarcis raffonei]|uniref:zinc finger protein 518B isoform X3 n=1 Tax=Podarcis raffonei TaxID=65483 RepID=UPI0023291E81|nr:zinc finger protein 518B isoform X3 [Podarcis raffonei]